MPLLLTLKPGRDEPLRRRHPWVFGGSVARRSGSSPDGTCEIRGAEGRFLGRGFASPNAPIAARVWTFGDRALDAELVRGLLERAVALRARVVPDDTDGYRVVHAEGDALPGLVVDRYGAVLAVQATTEGTQRARPLWLPALTALFPGLAIVQKNDLPTRRAEELPTDDELLAGIAPEGPVPFRERGLRFLADLGSGQKTGFFLDQRENRHLVRAAAGGRSVLNLFCYCGSLRRRGPRGRSRRASSRWTRRPARWSWPASNHVANGQPVTGPDARVSFAEADVFEDLRARVAAGETWDVVVTDPPAFAKRTADVERACRGYKDVNRLALKLLAPGGTLLACSCSGPVSPDLFQKVLFAASLDADVPVRLVERRGAGPDHPVSLDCPETEYLKAFRLER